MSNSSEVSKDMNTLINADSKGQANEVSDGNGLANMRVNCCKDFAAFCPCPATLWEAKLKSDELVYLMEEISR
jgi:hypothetical protein